MTRRHFKHWRTHSDTGGHWHLHPTSAASATPEAQTAWDQWVR